jgi:hypothetical protein
LNNGSDTRNPVFFTETLGNITYLDQFLNGSKSDHEILDYKIAVYFTEQFSKDSPEGVLALSPIWRFGAVILNALSTFAKDQDYDFTTNLSVFKGQTLFLYSEKNEAYGIKGATEEANFFQNHEIAEIKNMGHELIYFQWPQVKNTITQFLNQHK